MSLVGLLIAVLGLSGCVATVDAAKLNADDWVIVTFDSTKGQMPGYLMVALLPTEIAADEALQASYAGFIDGNEVGDSQYDLYFVGNDRDRMWAILKPILADAPVAWTQVKLSRGLEDSSPTILRRSG